ncbi:MAG: radical SAM (seleno)protein TrsS [Faecousia sp.]
MEIGRTMSVCPVCLARIPAAKTLGEDGKIYLEKKCWEHGAFRTLIWEGDLESYVNWAAGDNNTAVTPVRAQPVEKGCPNDCGLCQAHRRDGCCVLLELTTRCNLRCPVCFASAGEQTARDLSLEEIGRQYDLLMERGGPFNIQLSGGEPTLREDLAQIIALGREKGFSFFQLNTNGVRIADEEGYAEHLASAGVSTVFLQFDGLEDGIYQTLRGAALTEKKLRAVDRCEAAGLPVVLVPTVAPGVNDHALGEILRFGLEHAPWVRGVHIQPISYFGRCGLTPPENRLTIPAVLRRIEEQTGGWMKAADFGGGGAESPYCSFHASYLRRPDGSLKALPRRRSQCCCVKSGDARDFVSRQWSGKASCCDSDEDTASLDAFLRQTVERTFTVSGMVFQDAYNLDLDRLRRCYICEVDTQRGMVPFCAYNLTDIHGKALYRR